MTVILLASYFTGCATKVPLRPLDPIAVIGPGASYYLVVPVEANRGLLTLLLETQTKKEGIQKALDTARVLYAGVYPELNGEQNSIRVLAVGSFPRFLSSVVFSKADGWKKTSDKSGNSWYRGNGIDASIIGNSLAGAATADGMGHIFANLKAPSPVTLPSRFGKYALNAEMDGRIALYVSDAQTVSSSLFGPDISIPVAYAEIFAGQNESEKGVYDVSVNLEFPDTRTARAFKTLLSFVMDADIQSTETSITISSYRVTEEKLVEMASVLYFKQGNLD